MLSVLTIMITLMLILTKEWEETLEGDRYVYGLDGNDAFRRES